MKRVLFPLRREPVLTLSLSLAGVSAPLASIVSYVWRTGGDSFLWSSHLPNVCMGLLLSWCLAAWAAWVGRRWARLTASLIVVVPLTVSTILYQWFNLRIAPTTVRLMLDTTLHEALSFFRGFVVGWPLVGVVAGVTLYVAATEAMRAPALRLASRLTPRPAGQTALAITLTAPLLYGATLELRHAASCLAPECVTLGFNINTSHSAVPINALTYSLAMLRLEEAAHAARDERSREIVRRGPAALRSTGRDSLTLAVVIGETHIRHRSALYGYPLPNEPWLTAQRDAGRLALFTNAVSPATHTEEAVAHALALKMPDQPPSFAPAVFRAAGYNTMLCEHQDETQLLLSSARRDVWSTLVARSCLTDNDQPLAPTSRALILYHLVGQHFLYTERYPPSYQRFEASDIDPAGRPWITTGKRQREAEFANATLYNDHVIAAIAASLDSLDAALVYFSDHGEEVYDYRDHYGRNGPEAGHEADFLRCQAEVPLMIWWTARFARRHPDLVERMRRATDRPAYTGVLSHTLLGLAGIDGWGYDPTLDLLSDTYQCPRRLVNRELDYDQYVPGRDAR